MARGVGNYLTAPLGNCLALERLRLGNYLAADRHVCLIDRTGTVAAEVDPRIDAWWPFPDGGPIPVTFAGGQELGLMDLEGRVLVEPRYDESLQFFYYMLPATGGATEAGTPLPVAENEQFGFVDSTGTLVISLQYDLALWFSEGLAAAGESVSAEDGTAGQALLGYIDTEGRTVIPPRFAATGPFSEGLAAAVPQGGDKIGFIDRTGEWVIEPQFEWNSSWMLLSLFSEGLARMLRDNLIGYIDTSGRWVIEPLFPLLETMVSAWSPGHFSEGLAAVLAAQGEEKSWGPPVPKRWGYIDPTGTVVIPAQFTGAGRFEEGLAMVSMTERGEGGQGTNLAGYIDTAGNWVKQWVPVLRIPGGSSEGRASE